MIDRSRSDIEDDIEDVRLNMPWSDERDDLLDELYEALANLDGNAS